MNNFDRIAGYEKEKEQLRGLRELLLHLDDYKKSGIRIPRGVLLYGAPGVGKTVMAKAIAEAPIACVELCSADCTREDAADKVLETFEKARNAAPAVLLIDELDKITEESHEFYMEGNDRIMKILLQELDGQKDNSGVLVVATCNHFENINPALLRSGRFDRLIQIGNPSMEDRKAIIQYYFSKVKLEKHMEEDYLAKITGGYSGAQLECVINEAGILAMESKASAIEPEHIRTAMNRIAFRTLEGDVGEKKERMITATHEAGHALAALLLSPDKLTGASVIPHGKTRGFVRMRYTEENEILSAEDMEKQVTVSLAGAAAEQMIYGTNFLSSSEDFGKAIATVHTMITDMGVYGLDLLWPERTVRREIPVSKETADRICAKRTELIQKFSDRATALLEENKAVFLAIAEALCERYSLSKEEIEDIYSDFHKMKSAA